MKIIISAAMAIPSILCAGITAYFAVTVSPWWLVGTVLSATLAPNFE